MRQVACILDGHGVFSKLAVGICSSPRRKVRLRRQGYGRRNEWLLIVDGRCKISMQIYESDRNSCRSGRALSERTCSRQPVARERLDIAGSVI